MTNSSHSLLPIPDLVEALNLLLAQIPSGKVTTYGRLAKALGDVVASRWVAEALRDHSHDKGCLCHRVVRANGELGVYVPRSVGDKAERLHAEGVKIVNDVVAIKDYLFESFTCNEPLTELREWQLRVGRDATQTAQPNPARYIAGIDVSYDQKLGNIDGVVALVVWDCTESRIVFEKTMRRRIVFPYITTYLAFRELPLLLEILRSVLTNAPNEDALRFDAILVDGSGILHPRHSGIATLLGVLLDIPTIGVTKKHLIGKYDTKRLQDEGSAPVHVGDQQKGTVQLPSTGSKPLFVSPGHRTDCVTASSLVHRCCTEHRLPEPIYWADRISRQAIS